MAMIPCVHLLVCFIVRVRVHTFVSPCMCWREPVYVCMYVCMPVFEVCILRSHIATVAVSRRNDCSICANKLTNYCH